jgi:hypothetical protein
MLPNRVILLFVTVFFFRFLLFLVSHSNEVIEGGVG